MKELSAVMPGLVPGIPVVAASMQDADDRDKRAFTPVFNDKRAFTAASHPCILLAPFVAGFVHRAKAAAL
jgi:hypothetical protein